MPLYTNIMIYSKTTKYAILRKTNMNEKPNISIYVLTREVAKLSLWASLLCLEGSVEASKMPMSFNTTMGDSSSIHEVIHQLGGVTIEPIPSFESSHELKEWGEKIPQEIINLYHEINRLTPSTTYISPDSGHIEVMFANDRFITTELRQRLHMLLREFVRNGGWSKQPGEAQFTLPNAERTVFTVINNFAQAFPDKEPIEYRALGNDEVKGI